LYLEEIKVELLVVMVREFREGEADKSLVPKTACY
jgi:hypothetical protein